MIIFDLINDEAPLFVEAVKVMISKNVLGQQDVKGVVEGNRWFEETHDISCVNRLHFFDKLDEDGIDIDNELVRIAKTYDNFNIYACDRYLINKDRRFQIKMLVYTYLFYENLFQKDVTHYFTTGIAYSYNMISYQVSLKYNIKHISFYGTRLNNNSVISLNVKNTFDEVFQLYQTFKKDNVTSEMYEVIEAFRNKPKQPEYMNNAINSSSIKKFLSLNFLKGSINSILKRNINMIFLQEILLS